MYIIYLYNIISYIISMTTADKMETDYLWLKQDRNPDAQTNFRFHGYNYVMKRVPN